MIASHTTIDSRRADRSRVLRSARAVSHRRLLFGLTMTVLTATMVAPRPLAASTDSLLQALADSFPSELPSHVRATVARIPDFSRRFLALSYYFRRSDELDDGWSWTSEEVRQFRTTDEYLRMVADVERVRAIFAEQNPGYSLRVNIAARSLETQLRKWNSVSSVSRAANDFLDSATRFTERLDRRDSTGTPVVDPAERRDSFRLFLTTYTPRPGRVPTVAVPGLSRHGQLGAFDFKIYRRGRMIAGARSSTIPGAWDRPGWTGRLFEAVTAASPRFVGPLAVPYEPWHYNYDATRDEHSPPVLFPSRGEETGDQQEQDDE